MEKNRYYIDTSIWIDLYEDRKGYKNEPLGDYALKLFSIIKLKEHILVLSDLLIKELEINYSLSEVNGMIVPFKKNAQKVHAIKSQKDEAINFSKQLDVPFGDALHAILARDNNCILITRDKHFGKPKHVSFPLKPEDII